MTTVYDLTLANYGLERGLNDVNCATSYDDVKAYTPARRADYRRFSQPDYSHRP